MPKQTTHLILLIIYCNLLANVAKGETQCAQTSILTDRTCNCSSEGLKTIPGSSDCTDAEKMYIKDNEIQDIQEDSFTGYPSSLKHLYLQNNQINRIDGNSFAHLSNLRTLDLTNNSLYTISGPTFSGLEKLKDLIVGNNPLQNLHGDSFHELGNLRRLFLGQSQIKSLDKTTFDNNLELELLHLQDNHLTELPHLKRLTKLVYLHLENNNISGSIRHDFLPVQTLLKELYLSNNSFDLIQHNALNSLHSLTHLDLSNNKIDRIPNKLFEISESRGSKLQDLNLSNNLLDELNPDMFNGLEDIQTIDLSGNPIKEIKKGTFSHYPSHRLILNNCPLLNTDKITEILNGLMAQQSGVKIYMTGSTCEDVKRRLKNKERVKCDHEVCLDCEHRTQAPIIAQTKDDQKQIDNIIMFGGIASGVLLCLIVLMTVSIIRGRRAQNQTNAEQVLNEPVQRQTSFPGDSFRMGFIHGTRISTLMSKSQQDRNDSNTFQSRTHLVGRPYPPVPPLMQHPGGAERVNTDYQNNILSMNPPRFSNPLIPRPFSNYGEDMTNYSTNSPSYVSPNSNNSKSDCMVTISNSDGSSKSQSSYPQTIVVNGVTSSGNGQMRTKFANFMRSSFIRTNSQKSLTPTVANCGYEPYIRSSSAYNYIPHGDVLV